MRVIILLFIIVIGLGALYLAARWSLNQYGKEALPWTKEAERLRREKRNEERQREIDRALGRSRNVDREFSDDWYRQFQDIHKDET